MPEGAIAIFTEYFSPVNWQFSTAHTLELDFRQSNQKSLTPGVSDFRSDLSPFNASRPEPLRISLISGIIDLSPFT